MTLHVSVPSRHWWSEAQLIKTAWCTRVGPTQLFCRAILLCVKIVRNYGTTFSHVKVALQKSWEASNDVFSPNFLVVLQLMIECITHCPRNGRREDRDRRAPATESRTSKTRAAAASSKFSQQQQQRHCRCYRGLRNPPRPTVSNEDRTRF